MQDKDLIDSIIKSNEMKKKMWEKYAREEEEHDDNQNKIRKSLNSNSSSQMNCPVCGTQMVGEGIKPIALSPCGHTVCSICAGKDVKYCPICKHLISQKATNYSLQQIGETLNEKHLDIPDYKRQYDDVETRIQELFDKLEKNEEKRKELLEQERVANAVIEHLDSEIHTLKIKENILKEQLEAAKIETQKEKENYDDLNEIVQRLRLKEETERLESVIKENSNP